MTCLLIRGVRRVGLVELTELRLTGEERTRLKVKLAGCLWMGLLLGSVESLRACCVLVGLRDGSRDHRRVY